MSISEALNSNDEVTILKATETKLANMLDALPANRTRDAASLAVQIREIRARLAEIAPNVDEESKKARSIVLEMRSSKRGK